MEYTVGIIDDDRTKVTQLLAFISLGLCDEDGTLKLDNYKDFKLIPKELPLHDSLEGMVDMIRSEKVDALIIDFNLSSQQSISYNGVSLAQAIDKSLRGFPIFLLTSYQEDLYTRECFDAYQVFDFERYIENEDERLELNSKIIRQIQKYNNCLNRWKQELLELIPKAGESVVIDERILELDSLIENSVDGASALPSKLKRDLCNADHIQNLINKIDELIEKDT